MSPQSPPRMLLLWYLIPCWPHSSQTIYSLFQGRLPIIFQVDASGLHQIFKKYIESILPYIYGLQPDWFIIKVGLSGHLAPERGDDYSLPHNWIQRQFFIGFRTCSLENVTKMDIYWGLYRINILVFFTSLLIFFPCLKVGRGLHGMGRFLPFVTWSRNQKSKNHCTDVIFRFQSTCN